MSAYETYAPRGFYRNADRAVLGGVCAGFAEYFGFNLRVIRFLAILAFIFAMPMAVITYLAMVLLIPARSTGGDREHVRRKACRREKRKARKHARREAKRDAERREREAPAAAANKIRERTRELDKRLARIEKYVTSSRYQLDREFQNLK